MRLHYLALSTAAVAAAAAAATILAFESIERSLPQPSAPSAPPADYGEVPDFRLMAVDSRGAGPLEKKDLLGSVWIADFIDTYNIEGTAVLSANMARLQKRLPRRARLVSFAVDPELDTPAVLQRYAAQLWAEPGRWLFVTGPRSELYRLVHDGFKLPAMDDPAAPPGLRVTHSAKFVLVDREGRIRGYCDGEEDVGALLKEAAPLLL